MKNHTLIAADFETVMIRKVHVVYAIGAKVLCGHRSHYMSSIFSDYTKLNATNSHILIINFLERISNSFKSPRVYFHNLGGFDGILILKALQNPNVNQEDFETVMRRQRPLQIKYKNVVILDSYNIIPGGLDDLGRLLLQSGKKELAIASINQKAITFKMGKILAYLEQDVNILFEILRKFQMTLRYRYGVQLSNHLTMSSLAFFIFRKNFMGLQDIYRSVSDNINNFLRASFTGGITDVFKPYGEDLEYYDVNSLYPSAMEEFMPIGEPVWDLEAAQNVFEFFGFFDVSVYVPLQYAPPLSIKKDGELIRPTGYLRSVWFSEELKNAISNNDVEILEIHSALKFEKSRKLKKFVDHFYGLRINSGNPVLQSVYKLILNSLYGRLGMKPFNTFTKRILRKELPAYESIYPSLRI